MANKHSIITAVQNLPAFLRVDELKGAQVVLNRNNRPFLITGGFNMVFKLKHHGKTWAFRVWHAKAGISQERYRKISEALRQINSPYFAEFIYESKGLIVAGEAEDIIRMEWLDGALLKDYLKKHLFEPAILNALAAAFLEACRSLRQHRIAHGDLQEGNILIEKNGEIRFIDYDSVCIPSLEGEPDLVTGLKGYQHPSRFTESKASMKADYFSELIIYLSIRALAEEPALWGKYQLENTQYLLVTEVDFTALDQSPIYHDLSGLSPAIQQLISVLKTYLAASSYKQLDHLLSYLRPPEITEFYAQNQTILPGQQVLLNWKTDNATRVELQPGVGIVDGHGTAGLRPNHSTVYKLVAYNNNGQAVKEVVVNVQPAPQIYFTTKRGAILAGEETLLEWKVEHATSVSLSANGQAETVAPWGEKLIQPLTDTDYVLRVAGLGGMPDAEETISLKVFHKVSVRTFQAHASLIVESMPVNLTWQTNNATRITLETNGQTDTDVTGKTSLTVFPNSTATYVLIAVNALSAANSMPVRVTVQPLPPLPELNTMGIEPGKLLPDLSINLSDATAEIWEDGQAVFEKVMKHRTQRFSLKSSLRALFRTMS